MSSSWEIKRKVCTVMSFCFCQNGFYKIWFGKKYRSGTAIEVKVLVQVSKFFEQYPAVPADRKSTFRPENGHSVLCHRNSQKCQYVISEALSCLYKKSLTQDSHQSTMTLSCPLVRSSLCPNCFKLRWIRSLSTKTKDRKNRTLGTVDFVLIFGCCIFLYLEKSG